MLFLSCTKGSKHSPFRPCGESGVLLRKGPVFLSQGEGFPSLRRAGGLKGVSRNKDGVRMGYTERVSAQKTAAEPFSGVVVRREPLTSDRGLGSRSLVLEENSKVDRGTVLIHRSNLMLGGGGYSQTQRKKLPSWYTMRTSHFVYVFASESVCLSQHYCCTSKLFTKFQGWEA